MIEPTNHADQAGSPARDTLPVFNGVEYDAHVQAWINVSEEVEDRRWRLAAIAASLVTRYGENTAGTFGADVGVSGRAIQYYARTHRVFEKRRRLRILTFTHHQVAARSEDPQKAIDEAADKLLSTRQMEIRVEAEALPEEERHLVVRAAEERRFTGEETRRLVAARIEKKRKQTPKAPKPAEEAEEGSDGSGDSRDDADSAGESETANSQSVQESLEQDVEDIMEVCPYCGSPSSAWERRPPTSGPAEANAVRDEGGKS